MAQSQQKLSQQQLNITYIYMTIKIKPMLMLYIRRYQLYASLYIYTRICNGLSLLYFASGNLDSREGQLYPAPPSVAWAGSGCSLLPVGIQWDVPCAFIGHHIYMYICMLRKCVRIGFAMRTLMNILSLFPGSFSMTVSFYFLYRALNIYIYNLWITMIDVWISYNSSNGVGCHTMKVGTYRDQ